MRGLLTSIGKGVLLRSSVLPCLDVRVMCLGKVMFSSPLIFRIDEMFAFDHFLNLNV